MVYNIFNDYAPKENENNINKPNLAMELITAQKECSFEKRVFEYIKLYLFKLASITHAEACHIIFRNFTFSTIDGLKNIMEQNNIIFIEVTNDYLESDIFNPNYKFYIATLVWNKKAFEGSSCIAVSAKRISIELTKEQDIDINICELEYEQRRTWYNNKNYTTIWVY